MALDRDAVLFTDILNLRPTAGGVSAVTDRPIPDYKYTDGPPVELTGRLLAVWNGDCSEYKEGRSGAIYALLGHLLHRSVPESTAVAAVASCDSACYRKYTDRPREYWRAVDTLLQGTHQEVSATGDDFIMAGSRYLTKDGAYYAESLKGGEPRALSDFVFTDSVVVHLGAEIWLRTVVQRSSGYRVPTTFRIPSANFSSKLPPIGGLWHGSSPELGHVLGWVTSVSSTLPGVAMVGRHGVGPDSMFVDSGGVVYGPRGVLDEPPLVYIPTRGSAPSTAFDTDDLLSVETRASIGDRLAGLNRPEVIWPVLGWLFAAYFAPDVRAHYRHFPLLSVFGTPGGGKTMLVQTVKRFVTGRDDELLKPSTSFAVLSQLSSSNAVPVVYDEVRRGDIHGRVLLEHAKELYAGEKASRGTRDQTVNEYALLAPVALVGEVDVRETDIALSDRFVSVELRPGDQRTKEMSDSYYQLLRLNDEVPAKLAFQLMQLSLDRAFVEQALTRLDRTEYEGRNDRESDNLRAVTLGVLAGQQLGLWDERGLEYINRLYNSGSGADVSRVKPALHTFLEQLGVLAHQGRLVLGQDYQVADNELRVIRSAAWRVYETEYERSHARLNATSHTLGAWLRNDTTGLITEQGGTVRIRERLGSGFKVDIRRALALGLDLFGFEGVSRVAEAQIAD